jgi:hypothetical protein
MELENWIAENYVLGVDKESHLRLLNIQDQELTQPEDVGGVDDT